MKRALTTIAIAVGLGAGVAGCGSSSAAPPTPTVPPPGMSAARVLKRSTQAFARVRSYSVDIRLTMRGRPATLMSTLVTPRGTEFVDRGPELAFDIRDVGDRAYMDLSADGAFADTLMAANLGTGTDHWFRLPSSSGLEQAVAPSRPRRMAACMLSYFNGRSRLAGEGTLDGQPVDLVTVEQGAAGRVRLAVAATSPYLPLRLTRTFPSARIQRRERGSFTRVLRTASRRGCVGDASALADADAASTRRSIPVLRSQVETFGGYNAQTDIPVPAHPIAAAFTTANLRRYVGFWPR